MLCVRGYGIPVKNKSLSKGGIYYLVYNVLNMAFPFITGIYVAKKLFPDSIGEVAAAQNLAQYFVILAFLGIPTYGMREIAKTGGDREERSKVFSELYVINFVSTCICLLCYLVLVFSVQTYRNGLILYLIVGISVALNVFNISWLYEGLEEFQFISLRNAVFKVLSFLLLVLFVRKPEDYLIYAGITVIGTAGNYIVNMVFAPKFVRISFHSLRLKRHLKSVLYLVAVNLAIELYSLVDVTMMNLMSSKESIAFYKYGHSIHLMLLQVINTFTMVLIPRIAYYFKEDRKEELNRLVSKAFKLILICAVPMIVGIQFTADFLIVQMYGEVYINSAAILRMLSILLLVSPIGYLLGSRMLLAANHEDRMIISVGTGAVVNMIGNAILIPKYAEFGAAAASIISEFVVMIIYVNLGRKYFRLEGVKQTGINVVISALLMGIFLCVCGELPLNGWLVLFTQTAGAAALYIACLLLLKEEIVRQYSGMAVRKLKHLSRGWQNNE